jgi:lysophospholipase L1-like esterase
MSRCRIVCYGDSITQYGHNSSGWLGIIQSKYCRSLDIINRGFSGYNTKWLLEHFDEVKVDFENAEIVFILMGANDAADAEPFVPLWSFKENMTELGNKIMELAKKVVLIGTPWVNGELAIGHSAELAEKYSEIGELITDCH